MGFRELLILLLGLAIVAVILRGLYVAMQARRGQIRLAIDKNIPQDIDLNALELAELPGGGARVVSRDNHRELDPVERANNRAESMDLGADAEPVPVLMDSVSVATTEHAPDQPLADYENEESERSENREQDDQNWQDFEEPEVEEAITPAAFSATERAIDSESQETESAISEDEYAEEAADDILLDYGSGVDDGLANVQPDYPEEDSTDASTETFYDSAGDTEQDDDLYSAERDVDDVEYAENEFDEEIAHQEESDARIEPTIDAAALGDDLDSFSMTAGERIGGQPQQRSEVQGGLFDSDDDFEEAPPRKSRSLFSALRDKLSGKLASEAEDESQLETASEEDFDESYFEEDFEESASANVVAQEPQSEINEEPSLFDESEYDNAEYDDVEEENLAEQASARVEQISDAQENRQQTQSSQPTEIRQQTPSAPTSEVIVLNVMARQGRQFRGDELLHSLITSGLKFGDMNIFHHRFGNDSNAPVIFSLANILNPGTFDLNNMDQFSTIGVSLFLALPAPINNLDAFEQMLHIAQDLCAELDGELKDDHRNVMTAQTIEHYRQRVRDFELRQLKSAGARG